MTKKRFDEGEYVAFRSIKGNLFIGKVLRDEGIGFVETDIKGEAGVSQSISRHYLRSATLDEIERSIEHD